VKKAVGYILKPLRDPKTFENRRVNNCYNEYINPESRLNAGPVPKAFLIRLAGGQSEAAGD
jgi:hypothetical protein